MKKAKRKFLGYGVFKSLDDGWDTRNWVLCAGPYKAEEGAGACCKREFGCCNREVRKMFKCRRDNEGRPLSSRAA